MSNDNRVPFSARMFGLGTSPYDFRNLILPSDGTPQGWLEMICKAVREDAESGDARHLTHIALAYSVVNSNDLKSNKVDVLNYTRDRRLINIVNFREVPKIRRGNLKEKILFDAQATLEDTPLNQGSEVVVTVTIALPFTFLNGQREVFYAYGMATFWEQLVGCSRKNNHKGLVIGHKQTAQDGQARTLTYLLTYLLFML